MSRHLREQWLFIGRSMKRTIRARMVIASYLFQPVLYLFLFSQLFEQFGDSPVFASQGYDSYLTFFLPGLLLMSALPMVLSSGLTTVVDKQTGIIDSFVRTPVHRSSVILGKLGADGARVAVQSGVLVALAAVYGAATGGVVAAIVMVVLTTLAGLLLAMLSNLVALRSGSVEATSTLANLAILPLLFTSTILAPREAMPGWLQGAAAANPLTHIVEAGRRAQESAQLVDPHAVLIAVILVAGIVVSSVATTRSFERSIS